MQKSDGFLVTQNPSDFSYPKMRRIFGHPKSVGFFVSQNPTDFWPPKICGIFWWVDTQIFQNLERSNWVFGLGKLNPFSRLEKPKTVWFSAMKNQKLWVFALISCSCPLFFANFASSSATSVRSAWQWWVRWWKWRAPKTASNGTRAARTQN